MEDIRSAVKERYGAYLQMLLQTPDAVDQYIDQYLKDTELIIPPESEDKSDDSITSDNASPQGFMFSWTTPPWIRALDPTNTCAGCIITNMALSAAVAAFVAVTAPALLAGASGVTLVATTFGISEAAAAAIGGLSGAALSKLFCEGVC